MINVQRRAGFVSLYCGLSLGYSWRKAWRGVLAVGALPDGGCSGQSSVPSVGSNLPVPPTLLSPASTILTERQQMPRRQDHRQGLVLLGMTWQPSSFVAFWPHAMIALPSAPISRMSYDPSLGDRCSAARHSCSTKFYVRAEARARQEGNSLPSRASKFEWSNRSEASGAEKDVDCAKQKWSLKCQLFFFGN